MNNVVKPAPSCGRSEQTGFTLAVLYTSERETLGALNRAAGLAANLNARIDLIGVQVVPYPLPLERPPVYVEFLAGRLRAVAEQSSLPVEVHLYFGRDTAQTLGSVLPEESVVVIGSERSWKANRMRNVARRLRRQGHQVLFADEKRGHKQPFHAAWNGLRTHLLDNWRTRIAAAGRS